MEHPKLILHVDVSQSILVANPATGYGVKETLNIAIAKVALVRKNEHRDETASSKGLHDTAEFCWHDETPLSLSLRKRQNLDNTPPLVRDMFKVSTCTSCLDSVSFIGIIPEGAKTYFEVFGERASRHFTDEGPGKIYLKLATDVLQHVEWPPDLSPVPGLVCQEGNTFYHLVLPSFFNLLVRLKMEKKSFIICLRTTGDELPHVAKALDLFATGEHPLFGQSVKYIETGNIRCSHRLHFQAQQRISKETGAEVVRIVSATRSSVLYLESQIERFLLEMDASLGLTDMFAPPDQSQDGASVENPQDSNAVPRKVFWFTRTHSTVQPILIDGSWLSSDKGHGVCVRVRSTDKDVYRSLTNEEATMLNNVLVLRPDLLQAALNTDHFIQGVAECVSNLARTRHAQHVVAMCRGPLFEAEASGGGRE